MDIFVLIVSMVTFRLSFPIPQIMSLPNNFATVDLMVNPVLGLFSNLIAQLVVQVCSLIAIHYSDLSLKTEYEKHCTTPDKLELVRLSVPDPDPTGFHKSKPWGNEQGEGNEEGDKSSQYQPVSVAGDLEAEPKSSIVTLDAPFIKSKVCNSSLPFGSQYLEVTKFGKISATLGLFLAALLFTWGFFSANFSMVSTGLVGLGLEAIEDGGSHSYYSGVDLIKVITSQTKFVDAGSGFGMYLLVCVSVMCLLVVPVSQSCLYAAVWAWPLSIEKIKRLNKINAVLAAWQYVEVYVLAIGVAMLQIGQIAGFMVGEECKALQDPLSQMFSMGFLDTKEAQCFSIEGHIQPGLWLMLIACVLLNVCGTAVDQLSANVITQRSGSKYWRRKLAKIPNGTDKALSSRKVRVLQFLRLIRKY